ncbi:PAS domain-containing protein [Flavobacterium artemisiae]|uniref:histidine kinase n=1 Tax=Flavobacterium artemisiae TaxID=2126556 RepID=A0ABW4HHN8_9FLAO
MKNDLNFFPGEGEVSHMTRTVDWKNTALGPVEEWETSLRNTVRLVLAARLPMMLWWGNEHIQFCNDSCASLFGRIEQVPTVGQSADDVWSSTSHLSAPIVKKVMESQEAVYFEDQLISGRNISEELYCTSSYSPVFGDSGEVQGVLAVFSETTEKVLSRQKLSASEKRFEGLVKEAEVGIIVMEGEENKIVIVNDAYLRLINRNFDELINKPLFEVIPETDPYFKSIIDQVRTSRQPQYLNEYPYYTFNPNGETTAGFLNLVYQPHKGGEANADGVMVLCSDVTELVLSQGKLKHSEQQVRSLVQSAPFPIGVYEGSEMRITLANQAIIDVWDKGSDIVGKTYFDVLPELEEQEIYPKLLAVFNEGKPYHARNQRVDLHVQGVLKPFYFNYSFTPLFNETGDVYGVMNTAADVTDLNLAKIKVEQTQKNFRNLILQAPVSMCLLLGPEHRVEVANESMINLWGKEEEEVMNKPIFEALPDAKAQGLEELLDHVYATGETFTASEMPVHLIRFGNAETTYQNFIYEPYRDVNGNVLGVIAISNNVTQQVLAMRKIEEIVKERTEQLEAANENLVRSNNELAQFAYIASHDLQEPLRKISIFSQMLDAKIGSSLDEKSQSQLKKINQSSGRMQALISDVLAYSQLNKEGGKFVQTDLNVIVQGILSDVEMLIEQKNAVIKINDLPSVPGQPLQLSQLFSNLIGNSLKFQREGTEPSIAIEAFNTEDSEKKQLGLDENRNFIKIKVSDNGVGFKEESADKIFGLFQRLHSKSEFEGTGIGLSICSQIVKNHHGIINAYGSSENGAQFNIYLPLSQSLN